MPPAEDGTGERRVLRQRDLAIDFDVLADLSDGADLLDVRRAELTSETASVSVSGTLAGLSVPEETRADLELTARP